MSGGFKIGSFICCTAPEVDEGRNNGHQEPPLHSGFGKNQGNFPPSNAVQESSTDVGMWRSEPYFNFASTAEISRRNVEADSEMDLDKKRNLPPIKWIIGFDFGTTFSGFAYAKATGPEQISVYYDWPSRQGDKPYCKTLTGLYYKPDGSGKLTCASWGHIARSDFMANKGRNAQEQGLYLSKFKLLLKKDLNDPALAASVPPPLTVHSIIIDYLKSIGELALSVIKAHEGEAKFSRDSVQWCVTVPSIWDENAKQQMKACMVDAGLVSDQAGGMDAVKVVLEPEAASFHCHQILHRERKDVSLQATDKILVADVGGGTVDIVVQELLPHPDNKFKVRELTESSGGLCGGTFVDESFMQFLSKKIECLQEFLRVDVPAYRTRLLKDWEEHKCTFGHEMTTNSGYKEITLHNKLAQKWEAYETERGYPPRNSYCEIEITHHDMKSIFDPVVDEILQLIAAQLSQVRNIKVMFVVGGFSSSPYLMQRIRARFSADVHHIVCPQNPGSAICQGAVSLARSPDAIFSRILKKTYGTSLTLHFNRYLDPPHLLKVGSDGVEWCRNRFDAFVTKGQQVEVNKCVTKEYVPHSPGQTHIRFDLFSSTEQNPRYTEGTADVMKEGGFSITLPQNYRPHNMPVFKFTMYFGRSSIELRAEAKFKNGFSAGQKARILELPVEFIHN